MTGKDCGVLDGNAWMIDFGSWHDMFLLAIIVGYCVGRGFDNGARFGVLCSRRHIG